jgi:dienelactone hydrolase
MLVDFDRLLNDQESRRQDLYSLLGDLPDRHRPISAQVLTFDQGKSYSLETLLLDLNGLEPVPAYFIKPEGDGPFPCILYNHAHGGDYALGKDELIRGRPALQAPPYAEAFAASGWAALCIDAWLFGERSGRTESEVFKEMLWQGQVLWGMMVYDSLRAVDYLTPRPDVDPNRLGTLGMSMGSTMAWWLAALDPRLRVCVDICCLTDFEALIDSRGLDGHGIYYYVPSLLKHFSSAQINALIAPRPHLSLAGTLDPLTPPAGLDRIDRELKGVYTQSGTPERWLLQRFDVGHQETPEMRQAALAFLEKWL